MSYFKKVSTLVISMCFILSNINAQMMTDDIYFEYLIEKYPGIDQAIEKTYHDALHNTTNRNEAILSVPVVFHVIYNTPEQNLADVQIIDQLEVLNRDFRRLNEDASNTRAEFINIAEDAQIEFYLADKDPDGGTTTGITRTETDVISFIEFDQAAVLAAVLECGFDLEDPEVLACIEEALADLDIALDGMKNEATGGVSPWDTDRYLNIWTCNLSIDVAGEQTPFLLGFAYPPVGAPNWPDDTNPGPSVDGVTVHYEVVGRNNPNLGALAGIADQGRTLVHEVGHYLGLRHIWGDGDCTMDDGLDDTPTASSNSQPEDIENLPTCEDLHLKDTCLEDNLPDMIENYMDYSIESCQNMFTAQQVGLMRAMLEGPRSGLLENSVSSTENLVASHLLTISPNPATDKIQIEHSEYRGNFEISILSIDGTLVDYSNNKNTIDVSNLAAGTYMLKYAYANKTVVKRFVKL